MIIGKLLHSDCFYMLYFIESSQISYEIIIFIIHLKKMCHTMRCVAELEFELGYSA